MVFNELSCTFRGHPKRCCRAYRSRTIDFVIRAVSSWQAIFELEAPALRGAYYSCEDLAGLVKGYLGSVVSDDPSAQLSFQSVKKGLPPSCPCMDRRMLDKLVSSFSREPRRLPSGYLRFVRRTVKRLFPKGWDSGRYVRSCEITAPPLSSCAVFDTLPGDCPSRGSRSTGGSLGEQSRRRYAQAEFLDQVMTGRGISSRPVGAQALVVQSAGKPRPLTKFEHDAILLDPFHKCVYDQLSVQKWLLRGPPDTKVLGKAGFRLGNGVLVSGDYASATDNLPIEVCEVILDVLSETSVEVPQEVVALARRTMRPLLSFFEGGVVVQPSVGQMMGSKMSFPFLCLQNYLAFGWSFRSTGVKYTDVPLLINGDDILYQADGHFHKWVSVVEDVGLTVEKTKTDVEEGFGTINSTLLSWCGDQLVPVWSARMKMLNDPEYQGSLGSSFLNFLGSSTGQIRFRAAREWFRWHVGTLRSTGVSLPRLGFRGALAHRMLVKFRLHDLPDFPYPAAFKKHDVCLPRDEVCEVDIGLLSAQERHEAARECCALKWRDSWRSIDVTRSAIQWCLDVTAARPVVSVDERWMRWSSDLLGCLVKDPMGGTQTLDSSRSFDFRLKNTLPVRSFAPSRSLLWKAITEPLSTVRFRYVPHSVITSWFDPGGILPTYEEAVAGCSW